jgi:hypothetical protein
MMQARHYPEEAVSEWPEKNFQRLLRQYNFNQTGRTLCYLPHLKSLSQSRHKPPARPLRQIT